jgi:hypothetical protein
VRETGIGWTGKAALVVNGEAALEDCIVVFIVGIVFGAGRYVCFCREGWYLAGSSLSSPGIIVHFYTYSKPSRKIQPKIFVMNTRAKALVRNAGVEGLLLRGYWGGTYECEYT